MSASFHMLRFFAEKGFDFRPYMLLLIGGLVMLPASRPLLAAGSVRFIRLTQEDGLSQNSVRCMLQDDQGFLWFGTQNGLNRYDGQKIKVYRNEPDEPASIGDNFIVQLSTASDGKMWVGLFNGLDLYDPEQDSFIHYRHDPGDPTSLSEGLVTGVIEDDSGRVWVGVTPGGLHLLDRETGVFKKINTIGGAKGTNEIRALYLDRAGQAWVGTEKAGLFYIERDTNRLAPFELSFENVEALHVRDIYEDGSNHLWIATDNAGLIELDAARGFYKHFDGKDNPGKGIGESQITAVVEDKDGTIWIGGYQNGVKRFDAGLDRFTHYTYAPEDFRSLNDNKILSLLVDRSGVLWIGTNGGIAKLLPSAKAFRYYRHLASDEKGLSNNRIKAIFEDSKRTLWVGTYGGLNRIDTRADTVRHYQADDSPGGLKSDVVVSLAEDSGGRFWVGTYGGLHLMDRDTGVFQNVSELLPAGNHLADPHVMSLEVDEARQSLWICTWKGLDRLEPESMRLTPVGRNDPNELGDTFVRCVYPDKDGTVWIGTMGRGLLSLDPENALFKRFYDRDGGAGGLAHDRIQHIFRDSRGWLWVGTNGGGLWRRKNGGFKQYTRQDGLPDDVIYAVLEDRGGKLWISTDYGLSRMDPENETFHNFDSWDGLQAHEFNSGAYAKTKDGRLAFGGVNGFNIFQPEELGRNNLAPPIQITAFKKFNQEVVFDRHVAYLDEIVLPHRDNVISFEFTVLDFTAPAKNKYAYKLDGFHDAWQYGDGPPVAMFTNLDPGSYTFRVKGANNDGVWNEEGVSKRLVVVPPLWRTWWAYTLYVLAFAGVVLLLIYVRNQRRQIEYEHKLVEHLQQVDGLKDAFLANTSHELRTPLNGIIGLTESLLNGAAGPLNQKLHSNLSMVVSSARRLSSLVNDILDFSQMKNQSLELHTKPVDIAVVTRAVLTLSKPLAEDRNLALLNQTPEDFPLVLGDENRLEQILYNLIGNAVKFTEKGYVKVSAEVVGDMANIHVEDTGIGIPTEKQVRIFESFEQADGSVARSYGGAGLGLAITKQLVTLHGGNIWVESMVGAGSVFSFSIPIAEERNWVDLYHGKYGDGGRAPESKATVEDNDPSQGVTGARANGGSEGRFHILVVDDEPINRQVLHNYLSLAAYEVSLVGDGPGALSLLDAGGRSFDLVLLDIMMPNMSGYEVCEKIRGRYPMQELPVIFMTAKNRVSDLVTAFAAGANDYLTKPVAKDELLSRVQTHLQLLDVTRNLEFRVNERTRELQIKSDEVLQTQKQLMLQEKMASLGTLTTGVAHEINTPVGIGITAASHLRDRTKHLARIFQEQNLTEEALENFLESCKSATELMLSNLQKTSALVENFKLVAGDQATEVKRVFNVKEYVEGVYLSMSGDFRRCGHKVVILGDDDLVLDSYPGVLAQVVANLLRNSLDHGFVKGEPGRVEIEANLHEGAFRLVYADDGKGIGIDSLKSIFDPFFTTKRGEGRTGLGLHIVYNLVTQKLGGRIICSSEGEGSGTVFTITFPV